VAVRFSEGPVSETRLGDAGRCAVEPSCRVARAGRLTVALRGDMTGGVRGEEGLTAAALVNGALEGDVTRSRRSLCSHSSSDASRAK